MLILYANRILKEIYGKNEVYLSTESLERIIIGKSCIETVATTLNPDFPIVLYVKVNKTGYRIELKPNKNFDTITGFFEYTRDYSEILFETKEVPTRREIKVGDVYRNNDRYFLILKKDSRFIIGIIYRADELNFDFIRTLGEYELTKKWTYIGNRDNAAYNINVALDNFEDFIEEKDKDNED